MLHSLLPAPRPAHAQLELAPPGMARQGIAYLGAAYRLLLPITAFEAAIEALARVAPGARADSATDAPWEEFRNLTASLETLAAALASRASAQHVLQLVAGLPIGAYRPGPDSSSILHDLAVLAESARQSLLASIELEIAQLPA